ncbi:MAG: hypothetical protein KGR26_06590, partial [Cyanobacteria bacterium REEB65]|nr:hypothetical protein [Cyanobacteria bacterium REEB65]
MSPKDERGYVMVSGRFRPVAGLCLLLAACSGAPSAALQSSPAVPTPSDMRRILPTSLTDQEAQLQLIAVDPAKVLVPAGTTGGKLVPGGRLKASWLGGAFAIRRFFPFSFFGAPFFAPYL